MPIRTSRDARFYLHYGDVTDGSGLRHVIESVQPDEIYNLAAQSHVRVSFDQPEYTADVVATGTLRLLEAVRDYASEHGTAGTLLSGRVVGDVRRRSSAAKRIHCRSIRAAPMRSAKWPRIGTPSTTAKPTGCSSANGILFNHESERRGETFVTRKITRALGRIKLGLQKKLFLGNLEARRDWGYAGDYVEAMWMMLQAPEPDDYVVATGESHSVPSFWTAAATAAAWTGRSSWKPTRAICGPPKWTILWATLPRSGRNWAGSRR